MGGNGDGDGEEKMWREMWVEMAMEGKKFGSGRKWTKIKLVISGTRNNEAAHKAERSSFKALNIFGTFFQ